MYKLLPKTSKRTIVLQIKSLPDVVIGQFWFFCMGLRNEQCLLLRNTQLIIYVGSAVLARIRAQLWFWLRFGFCGFLPPHVYHRLLRSPLFTREPSALWTYAYTYIKADWLRSVDYTIQGKYVLGICL